ncbi:queuine tRNA-ribosyltransferase accessory subunit 2 [Lutzomyia longipalpis]|uniref:queuine tRNA-ribosyltransferase accessory subunit 2 n=1 Tax=Lutzomyia longipalpis TaxID=7200 RepID=UPI0024833D93|nr:queuine tRNA-ribosyltransferase accessory subunit 2 [Lutzomyia longipalpis]
MKFAIESVSKCSGRLGKLSGIERLPDICLKTPILFQNTRGGSIPYISREVAELTTDLRETPIAVNLATTWEMLDVVGASGKGISSFTALPECPTFLCIRDTSEESKGGHHEKGGVPMFTRHGKRVVSPEIFMDFVEAFQPDCFHLLCDGDTTTTSSKKRGIQSVTRSIDFTEKCLERVRKSDGGSKLRKMFILAPIVGGFSRINREKSIEFAKGMEEIGGFFIDGVHANGETALFVPEEEILGIVKLCTENLPEEKFRMIFGAFPPLLVLKMVQLGVDAFDSALPHIYSLRNRALVFDFDGRKHGRKHQLHIDLSLEEFREDFGPILAGCECLACREHTRAYVRHLIDCKELMGTILLNIHNFHHYRGFFKAIHQHIAKDSLPELIASIEEQSKEENFAEIFPEKHPNGLRRSQSSSANDSGGEEAPKDPPEATEAK